jgi:predicted amidohydrolase YtcJ
MTPEDGTPQFKKEGKMTISRREFIKATGGAIAGVMAGCVSTQGPGKPSTLPRTLEGTADLILHNGNILTVNARDRVAQAVAISKGIIQKVGTDIEVSSFNGPATQVVDLRGRTVTPGIIDAHNHMMYYGQEMKYQVDIRPPKVRTNADLLRVVKEATQKKPEGEWIHGCQGFPMPVKDSLTRWEMDEASPKHPVFLPHFSGQFGVANSLALKRGEVTRTTPDPYGGKIEKDEKTGEPTGRLIQYPAMDLVRAKIPRLTNAEYEEAVRYAANLFLPYGITSVQDVIVYMREHTKIYEQMAENQRMPIRLYILEYIRTLPQARRMAARHHHFHTPMCTFGGWKLAIDGGPAAGTALMYDKSFPGSRRAFPLHRPQEFNQIMKILQDTGLQISIHVVGDEGMDVCLDAFEKAAGSASTAKLRHRLEHANFPTQRNMDRMQKMGIIASIQPSWIHLYGDGYETMLGKQIASRTIPTKSFLQRGIPVAFSSDVPATMLFEPYWGFIGAVTRKTRSGKLLVPSEAITMKEALRAYTHEAAFAAFEEKVKGSIEEGKLADLAVWEQDLYHVRTDPASLKQLKVLMTVLGGKIVYQDPRAGLVPKKGASILRIPA